MILDSVLLRTYDLLSKATTSAWANLTFILTVSISIFTQFLLLNMLRRNKEKIKTKTGTRFKQLNVAITVVQSLLAINLIVSVISIVTRSSYSTMILILGVTISYATTFITLLLLLSIRFVNSFWFEKEYRAIALRHNNNINSGLCDNYIIILRLDIITPSAECKIQNFRH